MHEWIAVLLSHLPLLVRQVLASLLVVLLAYITYRLLARALRNLRERGTIPIAVQVPLERVLRGAVIIAAILVVLQQFNVLADAWTTLMALVAVIGVGFIAIWSILSNAFCALVLLVTQPFQIGDDIEILPDSIRGKVIDLTLLFTILHCEDGSTVQIPNNLFFQRMFRRRKGSVTSNLGDSIAQPQDIDIA